jgi:hypothetical protein
VFISCERFGIMASWSASLVWFLQCLSLRLGMCQAPMNGVPKEIPRNSSRTAHRPNPRRATTRGGANDQVHAEQPHESKQTTKSLSRNFVSRSEQPSLYRATSQGEEDNQIPDE